MSFNETLKMLGGPDTALGHSLSLLHNFWIDVFPLLLFTFGIVIYCVFIFTFYKFVGKRDILTHDHSDDAIKSFLGKIAEYTSTAIQNLIIIPILVLFWFGVIAVLLMLLSKNHTPDTLMLTALATVASIRITSYYNEDLSMEISKLIPFTILAIFLFDVEYFSLKSSFEVLSHIPDYSSQLIHYIVFVVLVEIVMRIIEFFIKKHKQFMQGP